MVINWVETRCEPAQCLICLLVFPAATSLISAVYSILRSLIALSLLYGFCFGALKVGNKTETE